MCSRFCRWIRRRGQFPRPPPRPPNEPPWSVSCLWPGAPPPVQRRWVYLEGIFTSSADIKHQLAAEHQKFAATNAEFIALMRKVSTIVGQGGLGWGGICSL